MAIDTTCIYVHTLCHWTLHFNEHCIFGVSSTHKKSTKICIQQIVMQPNMFYIMKSWVPYTQNRKSPPTGKSSQIPGGMCVGGIKWPTSPSPPLPCISFTAMLRTCNNAEVTKCIVEYAKLFGENSYFTLILTSRVFHSL